MVNWQSNKESTMQNVLISEWKEVKEYFGKSNQN